VTASPPAVGLLVNPSANHGKAAPLVVPVLERLRTSGVSVRLLRAADPTAAVAAVAAAVSGDDRVSAVLCVGGDGTVHQAVQALAGTDIPLGFIPAGTGNDMANTFGAPPDPVDAADAAAAALLAGATRRIDLARLTGPDGERCWWSGVLAAGFDSAVNERANRMRWPAGPRRYDLALVAETLRLAPRTFRLTLDGEEQLIPATLVAVGNIPVYGGGMRICPDADPSDGILDVTVVGPMGRWELLRVSPRVYEGTHVKHPAVRTYRAKRIRLVCAGVVAYADGERLSPLPVTVECEPGALSVLDPTKVGKSARQVEKPP
jgi:diacylglycerol kinase (ATP)